MLPNQYNINGIDSLGNSQSFQGPMTLFPVWWRHFQFGDKKPRQNLVVYRLCSWEI